MCSEIEQKFWARSSVFTGGYDFAAAAAVCEADDLPAGEILDLVSGLVDQSIVIAEHTGTGHTRYRMLTDIRQFGLERAEKDGDSAECRSGTPPGARSRSPSSTLRHAGRSRLPGCDDCAWSMPTCRRPRTPRHERPMPRSRPGDGGELDLYWSASGLLDEARHWLETGLVTGDGTAQERAGRWPSPRGSRHCSTTGAEPGQSDAGTSWPSPSMTPVARLLLVPAAMLAVWDGTPPPRQPIRPTWR